MGYVREEKEKKMMVNVSGSRGGKEWDVKREEYKKPRRRIVERAGAPVGTERGVSGSYARGYEATNE